MAKELTPYQIHVKAVKDCTKCPLSEFRTKIVLLNGSVPADVKGS